MSVKIHWMPLPEKSKHFTSGTSSSLKVLENVFGNPVQVGPADVSKLRAMAEASNNSFFREVADIVESTGLICIWGEW